MRSSETFSVVEHLDAMRRYALSLTRDIDDADDLVQDALVRAIDKRSSFRGERHLRPWLLSIVHNTFVNNTRRRFRRRRREEEAAPTTVHSEPAQEHAAEVARVIARHEALPAEHRAVLHLVVAEGLSYQQAAQVLNLPVGTLMSRLSRAREALRAPNRDSEARAKPEIRRGSLRVVGGKDGQ